MRARVMLVLLLVAPAAGCGGDSQTPATAGGATSSGAQATTGGLTMTGAPSGADRGTTGDATFAESGQAPEVLAGPEPFTDETTQGRKGGPHCKDENVEVTDATRARAEAAAFCLVNKRRARRGIRSLKRNSALYSAAEGHAADMVQSNYFSHESKGGSAPAGRAGAAGYGAKPKGAQVGENIAWGSGTLSTPAAIVQAWMNSTGHRKNMLRRSFREAGLAISPGTPDPATGAGGTYVQVFGRQ
jgi:uncharacterized protein YkwD